MRSLFLHPGKAFVSAEPVCITTILGSCVAVALYDCNSKIGGINHFLLPRPLGDKNDKSLKYGVNAITFLIQNLKDQSPESNCKLAAKLYGGSDMFENNLLSESVGKLNIELAFSLLGQYKIPVIEYNVGGNKSRRIKFWTNSFEVLHEFVSQS